MTTATFYITKYALTAGIEEVQGRLYSDGEGIAYRRPGAQYDEYAHGKDWHVTRSAAVARAEEMRKAALASVYKRRARLLAMKFS